MTKEKILDELIKNGWIGSLDFTLSKKIAKNIKYLISFSNEYLEIRYIDYDLPYGVISSLKLMYHNFKMDKIRDFTNMCRNIEY